MKEYRLKISPRMLELLSRDLYANVYFALSELIANAYDADAENVYIFIDKDEIRVEDDGKGMSEEDLENYLNIGAVSRSNENDSKTEKGRMKMGRKGVGKLSGLSISDQFSVVSMRNGVKNGFIVPKVIESDNQILEILSGEGLALKRVREHGTGIIMPHPKADIPKTINTVIRNLARIFPNVDDDFNILVIYMGSDGKEHEKPVKWNEKELAGSLATLIKVGNSDDPSKNINTEGMEIMSEKSEVVPTTLKMKNTSGIEKDYVLKVEGWIATYKTTTGIRKEPDEFSRNYLAIYSNKKMGQRNVLSVVSKNRMYESFIVGQLHIDLFEETTLPDMAMTNRQGYQEDDPRWIEAKKQIRVLTDEIVRLHTKYATLEREKTEKRDLEKKAAKEQELRIILNKAKEEMTAGIERELKTGKELGAVVNEYADKMLPALGLKATVDANKKKILISQSSADKDIADIIYQMLLFNGIKKEDIIYSSGDDPETNLPERDIYDYLRKFFVKSYSTEMIYVLFVTSKESIVKDWSGVLLEVGACWVTRKDHWVFTIEKFTPAQPLETKDKWVTIGRDRKSDPPMPYIEMRFIANSFCNKIMETVKSVGYVPKDFKSNIVMLESLIDIR